MNILLVNDDGYYAEGIQRLKKQLLPYGNVYAIAPKNMMSAKSCSLTISSLKVPFEKIDEFNYVVDGTPADCVDFAVKNIAVKFDLVVSGCNKGLNLSVFSIWSGTLGACLEAAYHFLPSIAFSSTSQYPEHTDIYAKRVLDYIFKNNLASKDYILSVNFPYTKVAKGIKISTLTLNEGKIKFNKGDENLYVNKELSIDFSDKNSDLYHVSHGYISIEPLNINLFNDRIYEKIRGLVKDEDF